MRGGKLSAFLFHLVRVYTTVLGFAKGKKCWHVVYRSHGNQPAARQGSYLRDRTFKSVYILERGVCSFHPRCQTKGKGPEHRRATSQASLPFSAARIHARGSQTDNDDQVSPILFADSVDSVASRAAGQSPSLAFSFFRRRRPSTGHALFVTPGWSLTRPRVGERSQRAAEGPTRAGE